MRTSITTITTTIMRTARTTTAATIDHDEDEEHECCHHHDHDEDEEHDCCHHHDHEAHHHHDQGECCHHHDHDHEDQDHECCRHDHHHEHHYDEHGVCSCGHHHHDHDADEVFTSWGRETAHKFSREALDEALTKLDSGDYGMILRAKGIVDGGEGWLEFDMVPGEHEIRPSTPDVTGKLCVIGSQLQEPALSRNVCSASDSERNTAMARQIPVYLFVGQLESGKTKFIQETMEDPQFDSGDKTLLLVCEEGEEEYDPDRFAFGGVHVAQLEGQERTDPGEPDRPGERSPAAGGSSSNTTACG